MSAQNLEELDERSLHDSPKLQEFMQSLSERVENVQELISNLHHYLLSNADEYEALKQKLGATKERQTDDEALFSRFLSASEDSDIMNNLYLLNQCISRTPDPERLAKYYMTRAQYLRKVHDDAEIYDGDIMSYLYLNKRKYDDEELIASTVSRKGHVTDYVQSLRYPESTDFCSDLISIANVDDSRGRFMVANPFRTIATNRKRYIPFGTTLLVEKALVHLKSRPSLCEYCSNPIRLLYKCPKACHTNYCSFECVISDMNNLHFYSCVSDCPYSPELLNSDMLLAIKLFLKRRSCKKEKMTESESLNYVHALTQNEFDPSSLLMDEEGQVVFKGDWFSTCALETNMRFYDFAQLAAVAWDVVVVGEFYQSRYHFQVTELQDLFRCVLQVRSNQFKIKQLVKTNDATSALHSIEELDVGSGIYCLGSFFNHSCDPNAMCRFEGNTLQVHALRNIEQNEEVTISYGPQKSRQSIDVRKKFLKEHYYFDCNCSACEVAEVDYSLAFRCLNDACQHPLSESVVREESNCPHCGRAILRDHYLQIDNDITRILNEFSQRPDLQRLLQAVSMAKSIMFPLNKKLGKLYDITSCFYAQQDDLDSSIYFCEQSTEIIRHLHGSNSPEYIEELSKLARLYFNNKNAKKAQRTLSTLINYYQSGMKGSDNLEELKHLLDIVNDFIERDLSVSDSTASDSDLQ